MAASDPRHPIGKARLLRRTGKTYDEIRAALRIEVSDDRLKAWLRGIPRPPATRRSRSLAALRRECRRLRLDGLSYAEIAGKTGASAGSLGLWLHDLREAPAVRASAGRRSRLGPGRAGRTRSQAAAKLRQERLDAARQAFGTVTDRDLLVAGIALYWAEGSKAKPWRPAARQVIFVNSDVTVVRVFLSALDLLGVAPEDRTYRLHIHESADVAAHERWWSDRLGVPQLAFLPATLKRHNPSTVRRNVGDEYHGCLVVRVKKSSGLYDRIDGVWRAIGGAVRAAP